MNDLSKISASHLSRAAYIYLRQSTAAQVEHNRESTQRQYALASKAIGLGWLSRQVVVVDEDLGLPGSGVVAGRCRRWVTSGDFACVFCMSAFRPIATGADFGSMST
jgi:hypothetical protein